MRINNKIDYYDKAAREGVTIKWDILQRIKRYAEAQEYQKDLIIPIQGLLVKNRGIDLTNSILSTLSSKGLFSFKANESVYKFTDFNDKQFQNYYSQTEVEYEKYAKAWKERSEPKPTTKEIRKLVQEIIKTKHLKGQEARFLEILSDQKRYLIKDLEKDIPTKNCFELKNRVLNKIKGERIKIDGSRGNSFKESYYQLLIG